ncbi:MAG: hypothetical protein AAFZ14_10985 [Pseudomonadota bacterium]
MRTLIYDIRAHDGSDTGFQMSKRCDVIAVEADPALAAALSERFANQIAKGRLTVLNVGIAEGSGALPRFLSRESRYRRVAFTGLHWGCFECELRGTWRDSAGVLDQVAQYEADLLYNADRAAARAVWYDIHARHRDARVPSRSLTSLWRGRRI